VTARLALFAVAAPGFLAVLLCGFAGLPPSGRGKSPVGDAIARAAATERSSLDAVSAINFDYRGLDTLGEELVLFTSVLGVAVLLRATRRQREDDRPVDVEPGRTPARTSGAVRMLGAGLAGPCVVFGAYLATHGQVSPGGGFQGGAVAATAPLVVYLSAEARTFRRIAPYDLAARVEAVAVAGYAVVGVAGLAVGAPFLANVLPIGEPGDVLSSGTILVLNVLVGLAVATGFVVLLTRFLEEAIDRRLRGGG
jgi:multicomponent Na+:H+ antiporter subunit B